MSYNSNRQEWCWWQKETDAFFVKLSEIIDPNICRYEIFNKHGFPLIRRWGIDETTIPPETLLKLKELQVELEQLLEHTCECCGSDQAYHTDMNTLCAECEAGVQAEHDAAMKRFEGNKNG